jgi:hypothetical protein
VGSFEDWSVIVGGILQLAGIDGFLANSDQLYEQADIDSVQWEAFLQTLDATFYSEPFTVAQVWERMNDRTWNASTKAKSRPVRVSVRVRARASWGLSFPRSTRACVMGSCLTSAIWSTRSRRFTRCKNHGGRSTGPKTAEGIQRIRQAVTKQWQSLAGS